MEAKVALITGGTTGIGRAAVLAFARQNITTVFCGRREAEGRHTEELVRSAGARGLFVRADVSDEQSVKMLIGRTLETFGRIDCAFNNAGITGTMLPTTQQTREEWDSVIGSNLTGTWLCMKHEIPAMVAAGGGAIVNMSSVSGVWGMPGLSAYAAAKHAVLGLTKTAAMEFAAARVRINAVAPAGTLTEILDQTLGGNKELLSKFQSAHPIGRLGTPEEVANAVVWLCSSDASFVTGHTLMIDGGATAGVNPFK